MPVEMRKSRGRLLFFLGVLACVYMWFRSSSMEERQKSMKGTQQDESNQPILPQLPPENQQYGEPGSATPQQEFDRLWDFIYRRQYDCQQITMLGGRTLEDGFKDGDGAYALCVEDYFWPYNQPNLMKQDCLVYSFGIGGDFSFDDAIANKGCEVHSFDPTTNVADGVVRESGVTFHKIGISSRDEYANSFGWKMRTLKTLLKELSHNGRYLDYLKVDTDNPEGGGFEEQVMDELLETGLYKCVRQFGMEIHLPGPIVNPEGLELCRKVYRQLTTLNQHGYRLFSTIDNVRYERIVNDPNYSQLTKKNEIVNQGGTILWEVVLVNFNVQPCKI